MKTGGSLPITPLRFGYVTEVDIQPDAEVGELLEFELIFEQIIEAW